MRKPRECALTQKARKRKGGRLLSEEFESPESSQLFKAFTETCAFLRATFLAGPSLESVQSDWAHIVEVSSLFNVLPAVAYSVKGRSGLPPEVAQYFASLHWLNVRRNAAILDTLEPTIRCLQQAGIDPIFLKGVALLIEGIYPAGTRLVGDADVLVQAGDAERAMQILLENGYQLSAEPPRPGFRHLPPVLHRESGLSVEVHTHLEESVTDPVLPLSWFELGIRTIPFRKLIVRVPDATRLVGFNFVHHRVNDRSRQSPVELRSLLDLALLRARHEQAIEWAELSLLSWIGGYADAFATYLAFNDSLFGQPVPLIIGRPDATAMKQLREYVDPWQRTPPPDTETLSYAFVGIEAEHVEGHCWRISLPDEFLPGDMEEFDRSSPLQLFEDERRLGPAFASPKVIKEAGKGAFAHRGKELLFSTADNANAHRANRCYLAKGWSVPRRNGETTPETRNKDQSPSIASAAS